VSINQFLITVFFAVIFGALLALTSSYLSVKFKKYYYKMTFKHEVLEPYIPKNKSKENK
jgi:hypothetical protein